MSGMDAKTARTLNIRDWVAAAGGPAAFSARHHRWSQAQVSQWISKTRPKGIGHALARDIEAALNRPLGCMDVRKGKGEVAAWSQSARIDPSMMVTAQRWVEFEEGLGARFSPENRAIRLAEVLNLMLENGGELTGEPAARFSREAEAKYRGSDGKKDRRRGRNRA